MSKKLLLSGLAIAMTLPGVASATEVTVGGIVQVKQFLTNDSKASTSQISGGDIRILVSASETVGDYTGYTNYRIDSDGDLSGGALTGDSIGVGVKGDFGDVAFGAVSDVQFGEYANDIYGAVDIESLSAWGYTGSFGGLTVGALVSPGTNDDTAGFGGEYDLGLFTVGATFGVDGKGTNAEADHSIFGAKASFGGVDLAAHTWKIDQDALNAAADTSGSAVKVSGSVQAWSWGLTIADQDTANTNVGDLDTIRLDFGTSFAGLGVDFRYNKETTSGATSDTSADSLYLQLSKSF